MFRRAADRPHPETPSVADSACRVAKLGAVDIHHSGSDRDPFPRWRHCGSSKERPAIPPRRA